MSVRRMYARRGCALAVGLCLLSQAAAGLAMPLSLQQAVDRALKEHLDIKLADRTVEQAKYSLESAQGSKGFSVDFSNTFYLKQLPYSPPSSTNSLTMSLPLYSGGKNEGNIAAARTEVSMSELDGRKTRQDVKLKTILAYYDVLKAAKDQAVDQETVDNDAAHLENVKAQYSAGNVAKADLLRSEIELVDAQQTLLKAKNTYAVAVNSLKKLIRWKNAEELEFDSEFRYEPFSRTMEECVTQARDNRPDLRKYRLSVTQASQNVEVAKADKHPSVTLNTSVGWRTTLLPTEENKNFYVGVTTSWNLFDSKITDAKVSKSQSAVETARLTLESQEDSAEVDTREYYLSMHEADKRILATQAAVRKAEEDYFIARAKYEAGEGILLDVIDAQLALTTAKTNYIEAQYDYASNKAKLENAMGMD